MNDKIKALAEQAGILCKPRQPYDEGNLPGMMCSDDDHFKDNFLAVRAFFDGGLDKFAELIVKECARISKEADDTWTNQGAASAQAFMEHFGVEE
jgi:hypothetical protein